MYADERKGCFLPMPKGIVFRTAVWMDVVEIWAYRGGEINRAYLLWSEVMITDWAAKEALPSLPAASATISKAALGVSEL